MNHIANSPQARYVLPQVEERTPYGIKHTDPYAKMFENRVIFLSTQVDDTSATDIMTQLLVLESIDSDTDITMYINSPGGSITAMAAIYDTMQYISPDVSTICLGQAASAASVILAGGAPGKRYVLPHSRVMIHQPSSGGARGQASDITVAAQEIKRMRVWIENIYAKHTGQTVEKISADLARDKFLTAEDALAYGLIDAILPNRKKSALAASY
jgi:ATP-dependent Clp protease protease subunit